MLCMLGYMKVLITRWMFPSLFLSPKKLQVKDRAMELAKAMESEDGVNGAVKAFFKHFPKKSETEPPPPAPRSPGPVRKLLGCF